MNSVEVGDEQAQIENRQHSLNESYSMIKRFNFNLTLKSFFEGVALYYLWCGHKGPDYALKLLSSNDSTMYLNQTCSLT